MAHFAQLNENNLVLAVTKLDDDLIIDANGNEIEELGIQHILNTFPEAEKYEWKQCSYNSNFRNKYPGLGWKYYPEYDAFIEPPNPNTPSWFIDPIKLEWVAPIPKPEVTEQQDKDGYMYDWDEENQSWYLITYKDALGLNEPPTPQ